ncbi:MAG: potassium-transporting ATPase subunit C [Bryobacterales bacterium]|nr:potassium-transporting ATPase subunit C [Bryobacterales bacterium]MBV9401184.1 potassium-transporting ATPase subunit C [Bryobacterales bacterium]
MWQQILPGLRIKLFMTVVLGIIYPLAMTGLCRLLFPRQANGSLITQGDKVIGSEIIAQNFTKPEYFHPRPSVAGSGYDATASGGSNLGPTSAKLIRGTTKMDDKKNEVVDFDGISLRIVHYCVDNDVPYESSVPLDRFKTANGDLDDVKLIKAFNDEKAPLVFTPRAPIPADAVTASASGLDPHISPESAQLQSARVAKARGASLDQINRLVAQFTEPPELGILGEPRVNVLKLNLALDRELARR